jgi:hypothetical protein
VVADLYDYGNFEYQGWAGQHPKPWPVPRLHTPEREEACLVEGRFGVADLDAARARFDDVYARCGEGWVEAVCVDGRRWIRVAVWTAAPDRILVEASSREAYAAVVALLESLEPPARRRAERTDGDRSWPQWRLHRGALRAGRPDEGPYEAIQQLVEREERRWVDAPTRFLDGLSPREAVGEPDAVHTLYELLEWAAQGWGQEAGMLAAFDLDRVRLALGLGRRW